MNRVFGRLDPETAHRQTLTALRLFQRLPAGPSTLHHFTSVEESRLQVDCLGRRFSNPLGLAAGFDKNGEALVPLLALGFGHVEVGTVTPQPQAGNARPRVARLVERRALLNRLGFPSAGAQRVAANLARMRRTGDAYIVGANLGPNRSSMSSPSVITQDYVYSISLLNQYVDYFVLNVSSPNTPGLVDLQDPRRFDEIGRNFMQSYQRMFNEEDQRPILLKLSPGIPHTQLADLLEVVVGLGFSGLVATNSLPTVARFGNFLQEQSGGISGLPIKNDSTETIRFVYRETGGKLPIIGCGGIFCAEDAIEKIRSGACLLQIYSGLVYNGPLLPRAIKNALNEYCELLGLGSLLDVRGLDAG